MRPIETLKTRLLGMNAALDYLQKRGKITEIHARGYRRALKDISDCIVINNLEKQETGVLSE